MKHTYLMYILMFLFAAGSLAYGLYFERFLGRDLRIVSRTEAPITYVLYVVCAVIALFVSLSGLLGYNK